MAAANAKRRVLRVGAYAVAVLLALGVAAIAGVLWYMKGSTPVLTGVIHAPFSGEPITIERDDAGVPRVRAADRQQAAFALGFLHAQERFFQMDLGRRIAAGELAELFGSGVVAVDKSMRVHRFRTRARKIWSALEPAQRALLESYTNGVNVGLETLGRPPVEYLITRSRPAAWRAEDTFLIVFYMYTLLQDSQADQDFNAQLLHDTLGADVLDFLAPLETSWDAPIIGSVAAQSVTHPLPAIDLHRASLDRHALTPSVEARFRGSNAWAVAGSLTSDGRAILANDMHLAFGMPNVFYRAILDIEDAQDEQREVRGQLAGLTLPGFPCLIAGSNGAVAWGFSNSGADTVDLVRLDQRGLAPDEYRTSAGVARVSTVRERIRVHGGDTETLDIPFTTFGPVARETRDNARFAQLWVAHRANAVDLGLCAIERAGSVSEALELAPRIGIPAQNLVVADRRGNIGWTIAGRLPRRIGGNRRLPLDSSDAAAGWDGWLHGQNYPRAVSPDVQRIWTANARTVSSAGARDADHGFYILGARARQIRDQLQVLKQATERDMLAIQLDDQARFLHRWRDLLRQTAQRDRSRGPARHEHLLRVLERWDGRAAADSEAYARIRTFRDSVMRLALEPFAAAVASEQGEFDLQSISDQLEQPLWRLVTDRPAHLLAPWFETWDALLEAALAQSVHAAPGDSRARTWGDQNRLTMRHPMSPFIPFMGALFDMPSAPLNGDLNMPLAQLSSHGPVMRFVVSPGHEAAAIFGMPGGQAGNPLAPYYGAGHAQWLRGEPLPFLAGTPRFTLTLLPNGVARASAR